MQGANWQVDKFATGILASLPFANLPFAPCQLVFFNAFLLEGLSNTNVFCFLCAANKRTKK